MTKEKWEKMSDKERWEWVLANQDKGITIYCDNDATYLQLEDENADCLDFDGYVGWNDGIFALFEAVGIKAECV